MNEAQQVAAALKGKKSGRSWVCRCPVHDDKHPSLSVSTGEAGRLLLKCHAGCDGRDVLAELQRRGIVAGQGAGGSPLTHLEREQLRAEAERDRQKRIQVARDIWDAARDINDTPGERYLRERGLRGPFSPYLRYSSAVHHAGTGQKLPAMIAGVTVWPSRQIVAVHRTYLALDGTRKAAVSDNKKMLGPCSGGAVRLAPAAEEMGTCEGIENGSSVQQETGIPTWAALSTSGLIGLVLPPLPLASSVIIFADNDPPKKLPNGKIIRPGQDAAKEAALKWVREGRAVKTAIPPIEGQDFNAVLMTKGDEQ